jgi:hypothetical protein
VRLKAKYATIMQKKHAYCEQKIKGHNFSTNKDATYIKLNQIWPLNIKKSNEAPSQ